MGKTGVQVSPPTTLNPSHPMKTARGFRLLTWVLVALFVWITPSFATEITWNNADTNFNSGSSWGGGTAPGAPDRAVFSTVATNQPDLTANLSINGLTFNTSGYTLSSAGAKTLTLTGNGTTSTTAAIYMATNAGSNTITADLHFNPGANKTSFIQQESGTALLISGNMTGDSSMAGLTLRTLGGARSLTLSGSNSVFGEIRVIGASMTLNLNNAWAIGTNNLIFQAGTSFLDNTSAGAIVLQNNNLWVTNSNLVFNGTQDLSFGTGQLLLGGAPGTNRIVSVTTNTLTVGSLAVRIGDSLIFNKSGAGTLAISGEADASMVGDISLTAGTLLVGHKASLGTGTLNVSGASTLAASVNLTGANALQNNVVLSTSTLTLGGNKDLTLGGSFTVSGADRTLLVFNTGANELAGSVYLSETNVTGRTLTLGGDQSLTISGAIFNYNGVGGTAGNLTIGNGTRTVSLTATDSAYTGVTGMMGIADKVLVVTKLADGGQASSIGASGSAKENFILTQGTTLRYLGAGDNTDRLFTFDGSTFGGSLTMEASGSGALKFTNTGSIGYGTNNQTRTLVLGGTNTDDNTFAIKVENNGTQATSLVKTNSGMWVLSGNNTFTGLTTVVEGALKLGSDTALGATSGGTTVNNGATLDLNGRNIGGEALTLSGNGLGGQGALVNNSVSAAASTGNITLSGNTTVGTTGDLNLGGVISGAYALTKIGNGTLTLGGNNTYTGDTTITQGTLLLGGANKIGNDSAVKIDGGTLDLADYKEVLHSITMTSGNLKRGNEQLVLNNASSFTGGTVTYSDTNARIDTAGLTTLGDVTFDNNSGGNALGAVILGGDILVKEGTTANFTNSVVGSVSRINLYNNARTFTVETNANFNLGWVVSSVVASNGSLIKAGVGTLTLSENNIYTGNTTISNGVLSLGNGGTAGTVAGNIINEATLLINRGNNMTYGNVISGTGNLVKLGAGTLTLSGVNTYTGATTITGGQLTLNAANTLGTSSAIIINGGTLETAALTLSLDSVTMTAGALLRGAGTLTLLDASSFTGGTVDLNKTTSKIATTGLTTLGNVVFDYSTATNSTGDNLVLGGNVAVQAGATASLTRSGNTLAYLNLNDAARTFDVGTNANLNLDWVVESTTPSSGSLIKTGAGTLTLSQSNTYTGGTTISEGVLQLGNGGTTGFVSGNFTNNATLQVNNASSTWIIGDVISGSGDLIKIGAGTLILSATNTYTGDTIIRDGELRITQDDVIGDDSTVYLEGGMFNLLNKTETLQSIQMSGGEINRYSAILTLLTNASFTGGTVNFGGGSSRIDAKGDITLGNVTFDKSLATNNNASGHLMLYGKVFVNAGTTANFTNSSGDGYASLNLNYAERTFDVGTNANVNMGWSVIGLGSAAIRKEGTGTLTLMEANTYAGGTTISDGVLQLGNGGTNGTILGGITNNATLTVNRSDSFVFTNPVTGTGSFVKAGAGTLSFTDTLGSTGAATVSAGTLNLDAATGALANASSLTVGSGATLLLSQSSQVKDSASVTLSGGTITRGNGVNETFGNLTLTTGSTIDFGTGPVTGTLQFGTYTPSSLLTVSSFLEGNKLVFASDLTGQLSGKFAFDNGFTSNWDSGSGLFTITAIPEATTTAAAFGLAGLLLWPSRRRILKDIKSILGLRLPARERLAKH